VATQFMRVVLDCDACQMEQRISLVTLGITDLARARSFMRRWAGAAHSSLTRRSASSKLVAWSWGCGPR
jgi:hypothetical protein